jgi:hypothetical protein
MRGVAKSSIMAFVMESSRRGTIRHGRLMYVIVPAVGRGSLPRSTVPA